MTFEKATIVVSGSNGGSDFNGWKDTTRTDPNGPAPLFDQSFFHFFWQFLGQLESIAFLCSPVHGWMQLGMGMPFWKRSSGRSCNLTF